jgi:DNA processing protein
VDNVEQLLRLNAVPFVEAAEVRRLVAEDCGLSPREAARRLGCGSERAARIVETALSFDADAERAECERRGIRIVLEDDPLYPAGLRDLGEDAPPVLYAEGEFQLSAMAVAVVGTRSPSPYGERMARRLGRDLAAAGACVVSGMARGIDTRSHEGALASAGRTWAVLGTGLAQIYPPENEPLGRRIVEGGGCLLSEFPLGAKPHKTSFPRRNRLIAALASATVVVESHDLVPKGAMDTAAKAVALSREVYAVPGPADSPASAGPLKLLKEGAGLACSAQDVLESLGSDVRLAARCAGGRKAPASARTAALSLEYRKILQLLESDTRTADQLLLETGLDAPRLSNILFELELQGLVTPAPGQRYAKKD